MQTINQIYNQIILEKETFASLSGLTSPVTPDTSQEMLSQLQSTSKVSVWRLWAYIISVVMWIQQNLYEIFKSELETTYNGLIPGTLRWYSDILAKNFQYGYGLEWNGSVFTYLDKTSSLALNSKIITQSAAIESNDELFLKIAKGEIGALTPLSSPELTAFQSYISQTKYAGVNLTVINEYPEIFNYAYTIQYDPLILTSSGTSIVDDTYVVTSAITAYIQGIPFNSQLSIMKLTDAIQNVNGVKNAVCTQAQAVRGIAITDVLATTNQTYVPYSGYFSTGTNAITYNLG